MEWKNQLTKTPYLVLFVILIAVGVGTASAMITITLAGNVQVDGDLNVDGSITGSTIDDLTSQLGFTSTYVNDFFLASAGRAEVQCDLGDIATGGGFVSAEFGDIANSFPIDINGNAVLNTSFEQPTGYVATSQNFGIRVGVVCADFAPAHVP